MRAKLRRNIANFSITSLAICALIAIIPYIDLLSGSLGEAVEYAGVAIVVYYAICILAYSRMLLSRKYDDAEELSYLTMSKIATISTAISLLATTIAVIIEKVLISNATNDSKAFISVCLLVMAGVGVIALFINYNIKKKAYLQSEGEDDMEIG